MEKQYKEGSIKHMLVAVLKAAQPEALTTQGKEELLAAWQAQHHSCSLSVPRHLLCTGQPRQTDVFVVCRSPSPPPSTAGSGHDGKGPGPSPCTC